MDFFSKSYMRDDKHITDNNKVGSSGETMRKPCCQTKQEWAVTIVPSVETDDEIIVQEIKRLMENLVFNQVKKAKEDDN